MDTLLLDTKTVIAAHDQEVWYLLYRFDQAFRDYTMTGHVICRFIELFTVKTALLMHTEYRLFDMLHHRDLPAITYTSGTREWYQYGLLHRDNDLPALIHADGTQEWFQHGQRHRYGLPAKIYADGHLMWFSHGKWIHSSITPEQFAQYFESP